MFALSVEQTRFVQIPLHTVFTHDLFRLEFISTFLHVKYYKRLGKNNKVVGFALEISWKVPRNFSGLMSDGEKRELISPQKGQTL